MRFGLDRMRRMMTALGSPERRFACIHVLGTNGKTSTTRMTAAILRRHGLRVASYTSPHLRSYRERLRIDEREVSEHELAGALAHAARAAERVNRTLAEDDHVTQFELLTAAALAEMARREAQVAVVEAGLGGRYDATAVIRAPITVLTNVGLEHTRWLGPTVRDIAGEKLAVLQPGGTLVLGSWLAPEALAVAQRLARARGARIVRVGEEQVAATPALAAQGAFQRRNFALARAAAQAHLERAGLALAQAALAAAARASEVPGRLQIAARSPLVVLDGAHNPDAVAALVQALPEVLGGRALGLVMGVLEDKDAARMLELLLPLCARAWFTAPPSPRALSPAALESHARRLGFTHATCEPRPARALALARAWAGESTGAGEDAGVGESAGAGEDAGVGENAGAGEDETGEAETGEDARVGERADARAVLATGSIYLLGELLDRIGAGSATLPLHARLQTRAT